MYLEALTLSYSAHHGQTRKQSCVPYIVHPIRVSNYFNDDLMKTIAVLHDVIEDTDLSLASIILIFKNSNVTEAVKALTRKKGEDYFDYIKRLKKNEHARQVKVADIVDNLSDTITICPSSLSERYNKALEILLT